MDLPIEQIIKAMQEAGATADDIAKAVTRLFAEHAGSAAAKTEEVLPKIADRAAEVVPKLVPEGQALPAAEKISTAMKTPKFVRPKFEDVVHAKTTEKFSDIMSADEFAKATDKELKYIRNSRLNAAENEQRRLAGRAESAAKSQANKEAHAATRTPEARRAAAAKQKEYFNKVKKGDK